MTEQRSEITDVERAAQREAEAIATNILTFVSSSKAPQGPEGSGRFSDSPNPAVKGHPDVQAALEDVDRKGRWAQLVGLCWGHANESDGGVLAALRKMGYKV